MKENSPVAGVTPVELQAAISSVTPPSLAEEDLSDPPAAQVLRRIRTSDAVRSSPTWSAYHSIEGIAVLESFASL